MKYYQKVLRQGEDLKFLGRLHWLIFIKGWFVVFLSLPCAAMGALFVSVAKYGDIKPAQNPEALFDAGLAIVAGAAIVFVIGVIAIFRAMIRRATTEIVVTNHRVLYKVGLFSRHTAEMNVSKIETVDVEQGVWGRIFGFGTVIVRGTGSTFEPLKGVSEPVGLRNAILAG